MIELCLFGSLCPFRFYRLGLLVGLVSIELMIGDRSKQSVSDQSRINRVYKFPPSLSHPAPLGMGYKKNLISFASRVKCAGCGGAAALVARSHISGRWWVAA